jgi:hypothetical protein
MSIATADVQVDALIRDEGGNRFIGTPAEPLFQMVSLEKIKMWIGFQD